VKQGYVTKSRYQLLVLTLNKNNEAEEKYGLNINKSER
jgi:hypothetical protein